MGDLVLDDIRVLGNLALVDWCLDDVSCTSASNGTAKVLCVAAQINRYSRYQLCNHQNWAATDNPYGNPYTQWQFT